MKPGDLETRIRELWNFDDPDASATVFQQEADHASDADEVAIWMTQVARAHGLVGRYHEAHALLDTIATDGLAAHAQARVAIERGRVLNSSGSPDAAAGYFEAAAESSRRAQLDGLTVDALHMTAIVLTQTDGPAAATTANLVALEFAESSPDPAATRWLPSLLNNLGWNRHEAGDYEPALECFERALAVRRDQDSSPTEVLIAEWAVARTLRSLDRCEEALWIQLRLATEPLGVEDGYVAEEIAACLNALGRTDEAAPWAARAAALLNPASD
jgi:tetratricopeptide (TPR) repeat protein